MRNRAGRAALGVLAAVVVAAAIAEAAAENRSRLIRSWPENVTVEGRSVPGRVEIWFDYTDGVAIHKVIANARRGAAETVVESRTFPPGVGLPRPSPEEIAEAMDIVRADRELAALIAATRAQLDGGFQIMEAAGKPCGPGSRCLKVQLMTEDRLGLVRNVIVDLTTRQIVYRAYVPVERGKGK